MSSSPAPAAGWYPDPQGGSGHRWWDGVSWTEHANPSAAATAVAQPALTAIATADTMSAAATLDPELQQHDRFIVRQWRRLMVHKYEVHVADGAGPKPAEGKVVSYVQQKRMSLRDKIWFYTGTDKSQQMLELNSQKLLDWGGRHDLVDTRTGEKVAQLNKKLGLGTFVRSTWTISDAAGHEIALVQERSLAFALARRYGPEVLKIFPYDFVFTAGPGAQAHSVTPGTELGHYKRRWGLRDIYDLDLSGDTSHMIDRRVAVGIAIALDALEHR